MQVVASTAGQCIGQASGQVGHQIVLQIPDARLWSPDDPFLYDLEVSLVSTSFAVLLQSVYSLVFLLCMFKHIPCTYKQSVALLALVLPMKASC